MPALEHRVALSHINAGKPQNWRGLNLMGEILMEVRQELRNGVDVTLLRAVSIVPLWTGEEMKEAQNSDTDIFPVTVGGTRGDMATMGNYF